MQTFLISSNPCETAQILDYRRLGKQRVEAIQILNILLGQTNSKAWQNHPAVKMWKGYEVYLLKVYLREMLDEWENRGYKNNKSEEHYTRLLKLVKDKKIKEPDWFCENFFLSHKSNLIRKNKKYYEKIFIHVVDNLPYMWPK